jgi:acyl-CoA reductase-like NAD-dependent aldehyde dehydrogenase
VLAGGSRSGAIVAPTLLENVPKECSVVSQEVFGPVVVLEPYATFKEAVEKWGPALQERA